MKKKLLKSSIFRFLERAIIVATSFMLTPFIIDILGSSGYGLWVLILSIMGWFNVINLGFPQAVQRQIVHAIALDLNDTERVNTIFSTSLVLFGVLGLFAVLILGGLTQVPAVFGVEGADQITLIHVLLVLSVKVLWGFVMNPFHGFFSGMLRFDIDASLSSLNAISKALMVLWLLPSLNIWGLVVATLVADIVSNALKVFYAKRLFPSLKFKASLVSIGEIKSLFSYSKHLVINGIVGTIGSKSEPLVVTQLFDLKALAIQQIANSLVMHATAMVSTVTGVFAPVFNMMAARKQNMEHIFIQTTTINIFVSTVLHLSLLMFGKVFINLWVGSKFDYSFYILYFAVLSSLSSGFSKCANDILLAQANHKLLSVLSFFSVIGNLSLAILLGIKYGLIGITIGGAINQLIFNVFFKILLFRRYNKYRIIEIYIRLMKSLFLTFSLSYICSYSMEQLNVDTWFELGASVIIAMPLAIFCCWVLLLDQEIKKMLLNFRR